jgi:hypothetical protein
MRKKGFTREQIITTLLEARVLIENRRKTYSLTRSGRTAPWSTSCGPRDGHAQ